MMMKIMMQKMRKNIFNVNNNKTDDANYEAKDGHENVNDQIIMAGYHHRPPTQVLKICPLYLSERLLLLLLTQSLFREIARG